MLPSIGAAPAASSPVAVLDRKMLWKGGIIGMTVPSTAEEGEYPSEAGPQKFVRFAQNVKGGVVNFFVHDAEPTRFCGTRIVAEVEIWEKVLADGRKFLYVDLDPTSHAMPVMHRIAVMSVKKKDVLVQKGFVTCETSAPLVGVIVIAPIESKIIIKVKAPVRKPVQAHSTKTAKPRTTVVEAVKHSEPPPVSTGSPELDRLVNIKGWKVGYRSGKSAR